MKSIYILFECITFKPIMTEMCYREAITAAYLYNYNQKISE